MKNKTEVHFSYEENKVNIADKFLFVCIVSGLILTCIATLHIVCNHSIKGGLIVGALCAIFIIGTYLMVRFCEKRKGRWR